MVGALAGKQLHNSLEHRQLNNRSRLGPHRALTYAMTQDLPQHTARFLRVSGAAAVLLFLCSTSAFAQGRPVPVKVKMVPSKEKIVVPPGFAPPTGMCRIWLEG